MAYGYGYGYGYGKNEGSIFSAVKESYRTIRTNLMLSIAKEGCKTLIFTSSIVAEGKTTCAANVAFSLAQSDKKVLILDLDLRKPRVHKLLKVKNVPGITNYLSGASKEEDVLHRNVLPNVDVITAGTISPNPAELISSTLMKNFLEKYKSNYDFIIIDSPPVNVVSDALAILSLTDGVVFVARYKYTHHADIKKAVEQISFAGGKIIGVVINGTDDFKKNGKYSRYSKYKYDAYEYRSHDNEETVSKKDEDKPHEPSDDAKKQPQDRE